MNQQVTFARHIVPQRRHTTRGHTHYPSSPVSPHLPLINPNDTARFGDCCTNTQSESKAQGPDECPSNKQFDTWGILRRTDRSAREDERRGATLAAHLTQHRCRPATLKAQTPCPKSMSKSRVPRKNRRKTVPEAKPYARGARSSWAVDEPFSAIVSIH